MRTRLERYFRFEEHGTNWRTEVLGGVAKIEWGDPAIAVPAFLTLLGIPLSYSIATGLSLGLIAFAALELLTGKAQRKHWMQYALAVLFVLRFLYLA